MADPERPTFTVGRAAEGGRMSFARVLELARVVTGHDPTLDELAALRAEWRARFPDDPMVTEPPPR